MKLGTAWAVAVVLYVVTQSKGNVIVIYEPNSFLRPAAAKTQVRVSAPQQG
jgi:hypothetical protein